MSTLQVVSRHVIAVSVLTLIASFGMAQVGDSDQTSSEIPEPKPAPVVADNVVAKEPVVIRHQNPMAYNASYYYPSYSIGSYYETEIGAYPPAHTGRWKTGGLWPIMPPPKKPSLYYPSYATRGYYDGGVTANYR